MSKWTSISEYMGFLHASVVEGDTVTTACGHNLHFRRVVTSYPFTANLVDCAECMTALWNENKTSASAESLTINGLPDLSYGTAKANGWHDRKGEVLTHEHAVAQLAALTLVIQAVARVAEVIRHPNTCNQHDAIHALKFSADLLYHGGLFQHAERWLDNADENGHPVDGSKTQVQSWLVLMVTELAEAMEAVEKGDKANFAEELAADAPIRIGDAIGAINDMPGHFLGPIDMAVEIEKKNERNKQRGYRHGGKQA